LDSLDWILGPLADCKASHLLVAVLTNSVGSMRGNRDKERREAL
jgi:hypothetical protein